MEIPGDEIRWRFDTSGGPGGQHANRSATRVVAEWDASASRALDAPTRSRIGDRRGKMVFSATVDETRSQWRNRQLALERLQEMVDRAIAPDPPPRKATKPSIRARRRRLLGKKRRGEIKRLRRRPGTDD